MINFKTLIFTAIILLFFATSIAAAEDMNITYIGFSDPSDTTYGGSSSFEVLSAYYYNERNKLSLPSDYRANINYHYINGYEQGAIEKFLSDDGYTITYNNTSVGDSGKVSVSVKNQNIVIFHMLYPGYIQKIDGSAYDDLYDDLNTAKTAATAQNRDLVFIEIQGMGSDVFDVIQDDYLELIVTRDFYMKGNSTVNVSNISADNAGEFRSLTQLMVYHLIENYASQDTLKFFTDKGMNFKKINVLYVGYDLPEAEGLGRPERYSGVFMFNRVVELLDRMLYRDYFDKITVVSYGTAPDIDVYNNTGVTTGKWWSVDTFEKNMGSNKLEDYDLIFFDGFFNDEILKDFEDVFGEINSDTNVIFNERFQYTPGSSTTYFVYRMGTTAPSGVPSRALENYPSGSNIRIGVGTSSNTQLNFDNTLDSDVVTPLVNGFLNLTMRIIDVPMRLSPPTSAAVPRESGSIWDPLTNKYFATVEDYKAWYETESGRYQPNKPYIGIFGFNVYNKQMAELASEIEKKGYNVVVGTDGIGVAPYNNLDGYFYDTVNGTSHVACFISMKNWALNYAHQPTGVDSLEILDVPVIKAVGSGGWGETTGYDANSGIPASTFTWMASASNVDGMIDFIGYNAENKEWIADRAIAWANLNQTSNANKEIAIMYYNYPPGKEDIGANYLNVMRSLAGDGAKARVTAGDSNVPISDPVYQGVLRELRADGYTVRTDKLPLVTIEQGGVYSFDYSVTDEKLILNEENLISLIYAQGINVGGYAPGVLNTMVQERIDYINDDNMSHTADTWWGCELISVSDYLKWLEHETTPKELGGNGTMDTALLLSLIQTWGEPSSFGPIPADDSPDAAWGGMIWNDKDNQIGGGADRNYIVVPMIKLGGVRLMPEPNRALASNKALDSATYHSGDLPPTHQYVAVYFWLNRGTGDSTGTGISTGFYNDENWKADAVVHFGTHGTQEWLPGTSVGLYRTHDWGPVLLPDIPNIYPYIVANVGEGLTAEYRGNAVILSHLTPPMIKTRLYDNIIDMETAIRGYQKQTATGLADAAILTAYRQIITEEVYALGWNDAFPTQFENYKKETAAELYRGGDVSKVTTADINKVTDNDVVEYLASNKNGVFDLFLENQLHNFVEAIKENSLSYGTHTYGTFNEEQIAPMVWNMWSRQGFDDVLLDTYFDDVAGIPTTNKGLTYPNGTAVPSDDINSKYTEDDILLFVEKMMSYGTVTPTADDIRIDLQSVFTKEIGSTQVKEDKIIYFLLGPSGFISDTTSYATSDDVVSAWENTYIDGESLYDLLVDELFEFYYYFSVPSALATTDSNQGTRQAANGDYLNDIEMRKAMVQFVTAVRASGSITYENVEKALASNVGFTSTGRSWYNDRMTYMMMANNRIDYGNALRDSGPSEMNALKNALSAGYISPSPGNDPVLNPHVLPTGRNFYGIDPSTYSTPAAWRVGKVMGEQLLIDYYQKYGEFPSTVSFMRFGVDFIQDEGTLEACLFYLLGCEPTWNAQGVFTGAKPVVQGDSNYDEMFKLTFKDSKGNTITVDRPRVDVVYNSA
ncbi:MAG: cobaltochelatase subunit CobN, partial [Methanimicrococcus sp.]|nr:cobaltochelatase subunit CobN [Methanimicrococcus sp.]